MRENIPIETVYHTRKMHYLCIWHTFICENTTKSQSPPTLPYIISGSILFRSYLRDFSLLSCTFSRACSEYVSSLIERQIDTVF